MNLLPSLNERDERYNTYFSQYKTAVKIIDSTSTQRSSSEQMKNIVEKFPYFEHTTPKIMAIAMHMALSNGATLTNFNTDMASTLIDSVFTSLRTTKDKSMLIIDVARYYTRLLQQ